MTLWFERLSFWNACWNLIVLRSCWSHSLHLHQCPNAITTGEDLLSLTMSSLSFDHHSSFRPSATWCFSSYHSRLWKPASDSSISMRDFQSPQVGSMELLSVINYPVSSILLQQLQKIHSRMLWVRKGTPFYHPSGAGGTYCLDSACICHSSISKPLFAQQSHSQYDRESEYLVA